MQVELVSILKSMYRSCSLCDYRLYAHIMLRIVPYVLHVSTQYIETFSDVSLEGSEDSLINSQFVIFFGSQFMQRSFRSGLDELVSKIERACH